MTFSYAAEEETVGDTDANEGDAGDHRYPTASGSEDRIILVRKSNSSSFVSYETTLAFQVNSLDMH